MRRILDFYRGVYRTQAGPRKTPAYDKCDAAGIKLCASAEFFCRTGLYSFRDYLKSVTPSAGSEQALSEAKGLAWLNVRFFAALRMTFGVLR
jgi:hypothetical protein